jgi:hypothetical protein
MSSISSTQAVASLDADIKTVLSSALDTYFKSQGEDKKKDDGSKMPLSSALATVDHTSSLARSLNVDRASARDMVTRMHIKGGRGKFSDKEPGVFSINITRNSTLTSTAGGDIRLAAGPITLNASSDFSAMAVLFDFVRVKAIVQNYQPLARGAYPPLAGGTYGGVHVPLIAYYDGKEVANSFTYAQIAEKRDFLNTVNCKHLSTGEPWKMKYVTQSSKKLLPLNPSGTEIFANIGDWVSTGGYGSGNIGGVVCLSGYIQALNVSATFGVCLSVFECEFTLRQ